ncbi:glutathione S-transferase family protein [Gammaproteobacteria bacterium]|nr:glutathione S-transferase family protein [Gammaproteobacteria bacterium]
MSEVSYQKIFVERVVKPAVLNIDADEVLVSQAIEQELTKHLDYLNHAISQSTWFAGRTFSMADIAVAVQLLALQMAGFDITKSNHWDGLSEFLKNVTKRASFVQLLA